MSTILKALKKLEAESEADDETLRWLNPIRAKKPKQPSPSNDGRGGLRVSHLVALIGSGIIAGSLFASAYWLFFRNEKPVAQVAARAPESAAVKQPLPRTGREIPVAAAVVKHPVPAVNPSTLEPEVQSADAPSEGNPAVTVDEAVPPVKTYPGLLGTTIGDDNEKKRKSETGPKSTEEVKQTEEKIPLLTDPRLTLQAISWSENPDKRFAVVNDRIVRAGHRIEAITIVEIEQNAIIFNDGRKKWRQAF